MSLSSSFHSEELHSWALCSSACHVSPISLSLKSENESWRVASDSSQPHGLEPARLLCPWNFQARLLEWAAIPSSRGWELNSQLPSQLRDQTWVSHIAGRFLTIWVTREVPCDFPTTSLTTFSYEDPQSLLSWSCSCPAPQQRKQSSQFGCNSLPTIV